MESLPFSLGGLRRADIPLQVSALHAKVAALLLHPRRHPWKVLMRRAFQRMVPSLGPAVLVAQQRPALCVGRSSRLVAYWRAFRALGPRRLVPPDQLTAQHVLRERLLHNCQIVPQSGPAPVLRLLPTALRSSSVAGGGFQPVVMGLRAAGASGPPSAARAAQRLIRCLPEYWRHVALSGPLPAPQWLVSACGRWVRSGGGVDDSAAATAFAVRPDGRLAPLEPGELDDESPSAGLSGWVPACVCWCPVAK